MPGQRMPERSALFARIERDAKRVKRDVEAARKDMAALLDPQRCGALIDAIPLPDFDVEELRMFEVAMVDDAIKPRRRRRRR
jgi:hypothetical protein